MKSDYRAAATHLMFIPRGRAADYSRLGWVATDAIELTHHGERAILMQHTCCCSTPVPVVPEIDRDVPLHADARL